MNKQRKQKLASDRGNRTIAKQRFLKALETLQALSQDFTDGSQPKWLAALREANVARDELWYVEQHSETDTQKNEEPR